MAAPSMSCPPGGQFYACASGSRFVGCCTTDPCGTSSCPAGNLAATSFDPAEHDIFADQQCSGGRFYTCVDIALPFWGCCKDDPCASGECPSSDLAGAFLSNNPADAAPFLAWNDTLSLTTHSSSTTISSAVRTASTPSISGTVGSAQTSPHESVNVGAVVGGAVGGFVVLLALVLVSLWLLRRRRSNRNRSHATLASQQSDNEIIKFPIDDGSVKATSPRYPGNKASMSPCSPATSQYPQSTQLSYSPDQPGFMDDRGARHFSHELPGSPVGQELESGQKYHPYRA